MNSLECGAGRAFGLEPLSLDSSDVPYQQDAFSLTV
jgi:hypothetical protein